jgi:hypothetical protein
MIENLTSTNESVCKRLINKVFGEEAAMYSPKSFEKMMQLVQNAKMVSSHFKI